jgi:hypothetical protein
VLTILFHILLRARMPGCSLAEWPQCFMQAALAAWLRSPSSLRPGFSASGSFVSRHHFSQLRINGACCCARVAFEARAASAAAQAAQQYKTHAKSNIYNNEKGPQANVRQKKCSAPRDTWLHILHGLMITQKFENMIPISIISILIAGRHGKLFAPPRIIKK